MIMRTNRTAPHVIECFCTLILIGTLSPVLAFKPPSAPGLPNVDKRAQGPAPGKEPDAGQRTAVLQLQTLVPQAKVEWDTQIGSPKWVQAADGFLSGSNGQGRGISAVTARALTVDDEHRAVKGFLNEHAALFGHDASVLATARIKRDFVTAHNGLRTVVWEQHLENIPIFEGLLIGHTTQNGELAAISSHFLPGLAQAADRGAPNRAALQAAPIISAPQAIANAAQNLGEKLAVDQVAAIAVRGDEPEGVQRYLAQPALNGETEVKLVWLPMDRSRLRLCWEVLLTSRARGEMFRVLIDVETGESLLRHGLTSYLSNATYRVYVSDSPSPFSPGHPTPLTNQPPRTPRVLVVTNAVSTNASPNGWINDGVNETQGNNVDAHLDRNADDQPDLPRPQGSPSRVFDFPLDVTQSPFTYGNAVVVQLFYWCNWYHDKLYELGFTEAAGNFQVNNFGRGGLGNDPVMADAQDGSGLNNANFSTPPDGIPGRMQMYIFDGPIPNRDGSLDAEIVLHEHTHGLSNRRVGGGVGISALQSAGMGEGWSDWYALTLLSEAGDDLNGNWAAGGYSTFLLGPGFLENYYFGIRRYPYTTDLTKNPLTFKDIDPAQIALHAGIPKSPVVGGGGADEVHNQGEFWCVTLWEARANLIRKYGFAAGNQLILQLVTDGMNLSPANPNFLQARDAIILADRVKSGGANGNELWAAFAKRGMGFSAIAPDSSTTAGVQEAFDVPDDLRISPLSGFTFSGAVAGPFTPTSQSYGLSNVSTNQVVWTASQTALWFSLSSASGTIAAGASAAPLQVSLNDIANFLPSGIYADTIVFSNSVTGRKQERHVTLLVGQPGFFTERFQGTNDLQHQTLTFTPDGSAGFYSVCREPASGFPTDPRDSKTVALGDDNSVPITLAGGARVSLYGKSNTVFFIGSNGYITLGTGDSDLSGSVVNHFRLPRISALFDDLNPSSGGTVSWQQLAEHVAVTFQGVPEYGMNNSNSFQIEMFYDGTIRLTHLRIEASGSLVGLSAGLGVPAGFVQSDLDSYGGCVPRLMVTIPHEATEGDGTLAGRGSVSVSVPPASDLTVSLSSSDTSEVMVPESVIIPAGQTSASFDVAILDDTELDGTRIAKVTASAPSTSSGTALIFVHDNEIASLTVTLPAFAAEGAGTVQGRVVASRPVNADVVVYLSSSDNSKLQVPPFAFILAGSTSSVFTATIIDEGRIEGTQPVLVTAHVQNWVDGNASISITDNESASLTVTVPGSAKEDDGVLAGAGLASISGTLPTNLVVSLSSSDPSRVTVPPTATILAGRTNGAFDLTMVNNSLADGNHLVAISASASNWISGSANLNVIDDDTPPLPSEPAPPDLSSNNPVTLNLAWHSGAEPQLLVVNGGFETGDFTGWTKLTSGSGDFVINDGTFRPASSDDPTPPFDGRFSALGVQTGAGTGLIYQDLTIPASAPSVTLSWVDRIRNFATIFADNQQFRVEVRDLNNATLAVLFTTKPGDPLLGDWAPRTLDLGNYRGQTIRLAFIAQSALFYLDAHLDGVSLAASSASVISNDVYFGTNPVPGPAEFLGTTTNAFWPLPRLAPLTTYYWQIMARKIGQTTGPVWRFTTLGEDHFAWSQVPSPQFVGQPFIATVTAKDSFNTTVTNFTGAIRLNAQPGTRDVTVGTGTGASTYPMAAFFHDARSQVIYLASELGPARRLTALALNVLAPPGQTMNNWTIRIKRTSLSNYSIPAWETNNWTTVYQKNETVTNRGWVSFEFTTPFDYNGINNLMVDFSFNNASFTFDGECQVTPPALARSLNFSSDSLFGDPLAWTGTDSPAPYADKATPNIRLSSIIAPIPITPGLSGPFLDGAWSGALTVLTAGTNVHLRADDGAGNFGDSNPFNVLLANDLSISMSNSPAPVNLNSLLTYTLTVANPGPSASTDVVVSNNLPGDVGFVSAIASQGACVTNGSVLTCELGTVPAGSNATVTITVLSPSVPGSITNTASVTKSEADPNLANNKASQTTIASNFPPLVSLARPLNGAVFGFPTNLLLEATASDSIGILKVEFFDGGIKLGETATSPYSIILTNASLGGHVLTARATDSLGATALSSPVTIFVRGQNSVIYPPPPGGWTYIYNGDQAIGAAKGTPVLDGTWDHNNSSSEWDGSGRGAGAGARGGISTDGNSLTIEDALGATNGPNSNSRIYFTRNLGDSGVNNAARILDDGVTISFRARLTPDAVSPAAEMALPNGYGIFGGGKGNFGIRQAGGPGGAQAGLISFSLVRATEDVTPSNQIIFPGAGLTMNRLNGDAPGAAVDSANRFRLEPLWSLPPSSRPYLSPSNTTERGLAYNPITGNILVASRAAALGGLGIVILNGTTGADAGLLATNGISGGGAVLNAIGAAEDGAIYAANLVPISNPTNNAFKIYRWANEGATPTIAFAGEVQAALRWGDTLDIRGAGANTQILIGSGVTANKVAIFTTTNGATFFPTVLNVNGASNGDFRLGVAFGPGNTFYGKQTGGALRFMSFDLAAATANLLQAYPSPGVLPGNSWLLAIDSAHSLLASLTLPAISSVPQAVWLYDLFALSSTATNVPLEVQPFSTANGNNLFAGAARFGGGRLYALAGNNGLMALNVKPADGTANLLPLDPAVFHEFWINIRANDSAPGNGTHTVEVYTDGSVMPRVFNVTAGSGFDLSATSPLLPNFTTATASNYLALGCSSSTALGAFDVDFFAYKAGAVAPAGNTPPVLAGISDRTVHAGAKLVITNSASDADLPPNVLTFSLTLAPAHAAIDQFSGLFTWTPLDAQAPSTNAVTVRVTDDGTPNLSDSKSFNIIVVARPSIAATMNAGNPTLSWSAIPGKSYRIQYKNQLTESDWSDLPGDILANGAMASQTDHLGASPQRFYRIVALP